MTPEADLCLRKHDPTNCQLAVIRHATCSETVGRGFSKDVTSNYGAIVFLNQDVARLAKNLYPTPEAFKKQPAQKAIFCDFCENERISLCRTQCIACWEPDDD